MLYDHQVIINATVYTVVDKADSEENIANNATVIMSPLFDYDL